MAIPLKDIPTESLTPDEVEALANDTFDYADREKVSMREADKVIRQQMQDELTRASLKESNRVFGTNFDTTNPNFIPGTINAVDEFTFGEKSLEVLKAGHRGLGSVVKLPGVALKAIGEAPMNRAEIEKLKASSFAPARFFGNRLDSPAGKGMRKMSDMLRRSGNKYINIANGMMFEESLESQRVRQQSFATNPVFRTATAVAESVPSYGIAVTAALTSGNPNLGLYVLGATTASSSYDNLRVQGVDPDLALLGATIEGSIEMITEKVPMDILMKGAGRKFLVRALKLGTAESFQELLATLGQNYTSAVVKDIDPENYATALKAARQEWSVISNGWQDSMAAGFFMGGGAAAFTGGQKGLGFKSEQEMRDLYGVSPRNINEFIYLTEQIKRQVKATEKAIEVKKEAEEGADINPLTGRPVEPLTEEQMAAVITTPFTEQEQGIIDGLVADGTDQVEAERLTRLTSVTVEGVEADVKAGVTGTPSELEKVETDVAKSKEIGKGEEKPRGTSVSVLAQAIQDEMVDENADIEGQLPIYRSMNMAEQAEKVEKIILDDVEQAKRIAFYQEEAPPDVYPENVFTGLRVFARDTVDTELLRDLALNESAAREHTILGKRIKSLDTDQDYADPVSAIKGVVEARKEKIVRDGKDLAPLEKKLRELQAELDVAKKALGEHTKKAKRAYGKKNTIVTRTEYDDIITRRQQEISQMRQGRNLGAAYIPNAQDFIDLAKIGTFHVEALGRDFAKWSAQMTNDFGEWVTPHLRGQYDKAIAEVGDAVPERKQASPEAKAKSALKAYKTKLKNQISELTTQIESGKKVVKGKKTLQLDEEARLLKAERDILQALFNKVFGKKQITDEKRIDIATKAVEKSIASLEDKISRGDTSTKKPKKSVSTPKLESLRTKRDSLRKDLQGLRDAKKPKKSPEQARLDAKKSRLKTGTEKAESKLSALDLAKTERAVIELDAEGQKLQDAYDIARSKLKAAQAASDIITEEEVRIIGELGKDVADRKVKMDEGKRRNNAKKEAGTKTEIDYGTALFMFNDYVGGLKAQANKKTLNQKAKAYLENPVDLLSDTFGIMKNLKATWDNSFIGRQGRRTFLKGLTGDIESARIWWSTFFRSFKIMWDTLKGQNVRRATFAEIVSDPDYALLKQSKVAINVAIEEETATDILQKIPYLGMTFRVSDNAFIESSRYMRYRLAKQYIDIWRKSGRVIDKKQAISLGKLANSQTGRGEGASTGLLNNVFWSPGNLRASVDTLTLHFFDRNFSAFARKQAALNLMRYISGAAMILALADWIDDDTVTWDSNSSDFGKIKIGDTRFSVGGGLEILVVLVSRLVSRQFTSATSGRTRDIDQGSFFQKGGKDLVFNFFENKFSPALAMALTIIDQKTRDGDSLSVPQMAVDGLSPLIVQNVMESGDSEDAANILAVLIAEALGVNVQTFIDKKKKSNKRSKF